MSDYLMLMQLSYFCPLHVKASQRNITNADLFCFLTIPRQAYHTGFHLHSDQPKTAFSFYLFFAAWFVFITNISDLVECLFFKIIIDHKQTQQFQ